MNAPWKLATLTAIGITAAGLFILHGEPAAPAATSEQASPTVSAIIPSSTTTTFKTQQGTKLVVDTPNSQVSTNVSENKSAVTTSTTFPAEMPAELVELQKRIPPPTTTTTAPEQSADDCEWMTGECDLDRDYVNPSAP